MRIEQLEYLAALTQHGSLRRLGQVQGVAGPAQRAVLGHGGDVLELLDPHGSPLRLLVK